MKGNRKKSRQDTAAARVKLGAGAEKFRLRDVWQDSELGGELAGGVLGGLLGEMRDCGAVE